MKRRIADVAAVRSGYLFRGRVEAHPRGEFALIQIRDFDEDHQLRPERLIRLNLRTDPEPIAARDGDVLFLARGPRPFATVLVSPPDRAIISGYFHVVRANRDLVRPAYLAWVLNHPATMARLRALARGSHMRLIPLRSFADLVVDIPSLPVQDQIVTLDELSRRERVLLAQLSERRAAVVRGLSLAAARRDDTTERKAPHA